MNTKDPAFMTWTIEKFNQLLPLGVTPEYALQRFSLPSNSEFLFPCLYLLSLNSF